MSKHSATTERLATLKIIFYARWAHLTADACEGGSEDGLGRNFAAVDGGDADQDVLHVLVTILQQQPTMGFLQHSAGCWCGCSKYISNDISKY